MAGGEAKEERERGGGGCVLGGTKPPAAEPGAGVFTVWKVMLVWACLQRLVGCFLQGVTDLLGTGGHAGFIAVFGLALSYLHADYYGRSIAGACLPFRPIVLS